MKNHLRFITVPFVLAASALVFGGCASAADPVGEESAAVSLTGPVVTATTALLPARLAASKSAGATATRVTRLKGDLELEQVNARGQTIVGFVLHPVTDATRKVTTVSVTRVGAASGVVFAPGGSLKGSTTLAAAERVALANLTNELKTYTSSSEDDGGVVGVAYSLRGWLSWLGAGIACGLAAVEGGANPIADADCAIAVGLAESEDDK